MTAKRWRGSSVLSVSSLPPPLVKISPFTYIPTSIKRLNQSRVAITKNGITRLAAPPVPDLDKYRTEKRITDEEILKILERPLSKAGSSKNKNKKKKKKSAAKKAALEEEEEESSDEE